MDSRPPHFMDPITFYFKGNTFYKIYSLGYSPQRLRLIPGFLNNSDVLIICLSQGKSNYLTV